MEKENTINNYFASFTDEKGIFNFPEQINNKLSIPGWINKYKGKRSRTE